MVLNNYFAYLASIAKPFSEYSGDANAWATSDVGIRKLDGTALAMLYSFGSNCAMNVITWGMNSVREPLSVKLGTGTTTPTKSDYALENDITSSITNLSYTFQTTYENGATKTIAVITGVNNTGSSITINEVGIVKNIPSWSYYGGKVDQYTMLIREVLNAPKVVGEGEGFTLAFEWAEA